ncbi:MAG: 2-amino-4-hydroxy-6-hydroxymethyldihydropteridine diphosphokinase [Arenimonas sp.]
MTATPVRAFIALGGNLGDVAATFAAALDSIDALPGTHVRARSSLYRNPPLGGAAQPDYLNAVVAVDTQLSAPQLLDALLAIERRFGRTRDASARWASRTLDLDLALYGEHVVDAPGLRVPHPGLHERAFVLVPLAQIAPEAIVPGHGPVHALLAAVDSSTLVALP